MKSSGQSRPRNSLERGILLPSNVTMNRGRQSNLPRTPMKMNTSDVQTLENALISEVASQKEEQEIPSFLGSQHKLQSDFRNLYEK